MKIFNLFIVTSIMSLTTVKGQDVTCQELLSFVLRNGYYKGEVSSYALISSSWLKSVKAYEYKNSVFVVAEIKKDEFSYQARTYLFCGIPKRNWDNFESSFIESRLSYGEKFHKYIIDYQCDCN